MLAQTCSVWVDLRIAVIDGVGILDAPERIRSRLNGDEDRRTMDSRETGQYRLSKIVDRSISKFYQRRRVRARDRP